jgi:hypothetical protein
VQEIYGRSLRTSQAGLLCRTVELTSGKNPLPDTRSAHANRGSCFFAGKSNECGLKDVTWHGCRPNDPGWNDPNARAPAFTAWALTLDQPPADGGLSGLPGLPAHASAILDLWVNLPSETVFLHFGASGYEPQEESGELSEWKHAFSS